MANSSDEKEQPENTDQKKSQTLLVFISGAVLLLIVLAAVLYKDKMTNTTFWVVRLVATMGAAAFGSLIPGYLQLDGAGWKAGGAVAFGLLAYLFNPPPIDASHDVHINGIVFVNGKKAEGVEVGTSGLTAGYITGNYGEFNLTIPQDKLEKEITFDFRYTPSDSAFKKIDTSIKLVDSFFLKPQFEIRLIADSIPPKAVIIAGTVYDKNNDGLPGVTISALGVSAVTDAGGLFRFSVTTKSKQTAISFSKAGFHTKTITYNIPDDKLNVTLYPK